MTPLLLFLLGCAAIYLGTVSAGFNALMRLSLRIHAELFCHYLNLCLEMRGHSGSR